MESACLWGLETSSNRQHSVETWCHYIYITVYVLHCILDIVHDFEEEIDNILKWVPTTASGSFKAVQV